LIEGKSSGMSKLNKNVKKIVNKGKKTRIYDWFTGTVNDNTVNFRFTYSWDMNKQVLVKNIKTGTTEYMSLDNFHNTVKAEKVTDRYILA
jgi:hypothetical protein